MSILFSPKQRYGFSWELQIIKFSTLTFSMYSQLKMELKKKSYPLKVSGFTSQSTLGLIFSFPQLLLKFEKSGVEAI